MLPILETAMSEQPVRKLPIRVSALAFRFADLLPGDRFCFINEEHGRNYTTLSDPCTKTGSDTYASEGEEPIGPNRQVRQRKVYRLVSTSNRKEAPPERERTTEERVSPSRSFTSLWEGRKYRGKP